MDTSLALTALMAGPTGSDCADLRDPSVANFAVSIFIVFGILISYLPQHYRLVSRRSSEGISPWFVLLGTTSGTCAFANIINIRASRHALTCCLHITSYECAAGVLGIAQIGVQWACFFLILFLFVLFFPHATSLRPSPKSKPNASTNPGEGPSFRTAIVVFTICILHLLAVFLLSIFLIYLHSDAIVTWAYALGVLGTVLATMQFLPQIWTTWQLQAVGSLSIPMMCIQTPGSFVWVGSLATRLGWEGWSTWGIYAVTGVLQGCLLVMGIYFEIKKRRRIKDGGLGANGNGHMSVPEEDAEDDANEHTRLINDQR